MDEEQTQITPAQVQLDMGHPSLGRIVIYKTTPAQRERWTRDYGGNSHLMELPAMVTCVHDGSVGYINLRVFLDAKTTEAWVTSVYPGDQPGTWHWPPRK